MSKSIFVSCELCGHPCEKGFNRDYCTFAGDGVAKACKNYDYVARSRWLAEQQSKWHYAPATTTWDGEDTRPLPYVPPSKRQLTQADNYIYNPKISNQFPEDELVEFEIEELHDDCTRTNGYAAWFWHNTGNPDLDDIIKKAEG